MRVTTTVPALWCIDVEPDGFQPRGEPWSGFAAAVELVERLRQRLADCSGHPVHPTWFLRLDPMIAQACGRADFVFERHGDLVDRLVDAGDACGIHVHPYRWDTAQATWYTDNTDPAWTRHCIEVAVDTFTRRFGSPPRVYRSGGYHLASFVVDTCASLGVQVDLTAEPGLPPLIRDPSFGSWATGPSTDFRAFPTHPYRPSRHDIAMPALDAAAARPVLLVPLSSSDDPKALAPWPRRALRRVLGRPRFGPQPLSMWRRWPSPQTYWDLVARMLDAGVDPHFAFAVRSDAPASTTAANIASLLEHLPSHPVSRRLQFVDPLAPQVAALAR